MGDLIVSADFIDLGTITSRTETFPDDNVGDYRHLKRRFRAGDADTNDWILKFDFGGAKSAVAVVLCDVNYDRLQIQGNAADAWGPPAFDSGAILVYQSKMTRRYNVFIPLTSFNFRWMRIFIPLGASAVGEYVSRWETGAVVLLDSYETIEKYTYTRTTTKAFVDNELPHGGIERISLGDEMRWEGVIEFPPRVESDEDQYWTFNAFDISLPMILYENRGHTQDVYLCVRDDMYEGRMDYDFLTTGSSIRLKELI